MLIQTPIENRHVAYTHEVDPLIYAALCVVGYSEQHVARLLGIHRNSMRQMAHKGRELPQDVRDRLEIVVVNAARDIATVAASHDPKNVAQQLHEGYLKATAAYLYQVVRDSRLIGNQGPPSTRGRPRVR